MGILPTTAGTRPRLACELRPGGVVAARAEDATRLLSGIGGAELHAGALQPGLHAGNVADAAGVAAALRRALEAIGANGATGKHVTLVVPDAAVRVILLDFDTLPHKAAEALSVVRFRLKKLVPFEVDDAAVSYQVMSQEKGQVRVLAVAMPTEVLAEYEAAVRDAGYEPGAVLPSTLAVLAGLEEANAWLVVNASPEAVTTAIVQSGVVLLHRSEDMQEALPESAAPVVPSPVVPSLVVPSPVVPSERERMEDPVGYNDRIAAAAAVQMQELVRIERHEEAALGPAFEIAQAVSVAAAYFEDSLGTRPEMVLAAGTIGAEGLGAMLEGSGLRVREIVEADAIAAGAATSAVRRGWLAGVRGALRG